jgi:hypothetical protein
LQLSRGLLPFGSAGDCGLEIDHGNLGCRRRLSSGNRREREDGKNWNYKSNLHSDSFK